MDHTLRSKPFENSGYTEAAAGEMFKITDAWGLPQADRISASGGEIQALVFFESSTKDPSV